MSTTGRLAVFVSGNGSNLQAVLDAITSGSLSAEVAVVVSNSADAYALTRAEGAKVPTLVRPHLPAVSRADYDSALAAEVATFNVDLVVLAGWDRLLTPDFVGRHPVINLHPAKPGRYPGLGAIERCFEAWRRGEETAGGVMVHYVPDEGVDNGPTIIWEEVPFEDEDTLNTFADRVHATEHRLIVEAIAEVLSLLETQRLR